MLEKPLSIPDSVLEKFHCSQCNHYLSCEPIRVLPDGSCICGRCTSPGIDTPIYRVMALEAVLSRILFPCQFKQRGCVEFLSFGQTTEHELQCTFRSFACPLIPACDCGWQGSAEEIPTHFQQKHSEHILEDANFKMKLDEDIGSIFMIIKESIGFIIRYQYESGNRFLKYEIGYCKNRNIPKVFYKIQLFNDSDFDCNLGLKSVQCKAYNESLQDLHNPTVISLHNFLHILDNPTAVAVKFTITQTEVKNNPINLDCDLLKKLRCENCHNYLIPPLFENSGRVICCDCSKIVPDCTPLNNKKIQKLVEETSFPCRWRDCKFIGKSDKYKLHELSCSFRHYDCFFPSCRDSFKLASAVDHLQSHRAQYFPDKIAYKTRFSETYSIKHIFTVKGNTIILIQHSVVDLQEHFVHRVALFSSNPGDVASNIEFEHEHCKLRSKPFIIVNRHNTDIPLDELPSCFKAVDELSVSVNI